MKKVNEKIRVRETNINYFGSKMVIEKYNNANNIQVKFIDSGYIKNTTYDYFKKGVVKHPYDKSTHGIGYIGVGDYKPTYNKKETKQHTVWASMIQRCYSEKFQENNFTYIGCTVCDEWHNFQNFAKWYDDNIYEIKGERIHLDKDILIKGNKMYSPETCVFVPQTINSLFLKSDSKRGKLPIGVMNNSRSKKFIAKGNATEIGRYNTSEEAFQAYKQYKEQLIKQTAEDYKEKIPIKLYNAMINYIVEITD